MNFKNLAALAALTLFSYNSYAQTFFYLKPYGGTGYTSATHKNVYNSTVKERGILATQAGIAVGYAQGAWRTEMGLQYLETGYKILPVYISGGNNKLMDSGSYSLRFRHLVLPLNIGYALKAGKKMNIIPALGIAALWNMNATSRLKTTLHDDKYTYQSAEFSRTYRKVVFAGMVHLGLEYNLSSQLALTADPQFCYMVSSMYDNRGYSTFPYKQHNYALTTTVGICWWLNHRQKAAETNPPVKM